MLKTLNTEDLKHLKPKIRTKIVQTGLSTKYLHVLVDHKLDSSKSAGIVALWCKWLQEGHPQSGTEVHCFSEPKSTPDHNGASSAVPSRT